MKKLLIISAVFILLACSSKYIMLKDSHLNVVNREISPIHKTSNAIALNNKPGDGLAVIENADFEIGSLELDIKGENTPGRSFVGMAFNIQNDSTYEAIYFRPFNFQSDEKVRRQRSVQYISHPKHTWRYLRTNFPRQFEAEFERQPSPDDWFAVKILVEKERVTVFDGESDVELLSVERLETQKSNKVGLWTGNNSKGEFRNLKINKE